MNILLFKLLTDDAYKFAIERFVAAKNFKNTKELLKAVHEHIHKFKCIVIREHSMKRPIRKKQCQNVRNI